LKSVRILIAAGANVNAKDKLGGTALIRGCGSPEIIKLLIAAGAQVNERDIYGDTILMRVSRQGDIEGVRLLLAVGADPAIQNEDRKSASDLAREYGKYAIAKLLDEAIAKQKANQRERQ
jgi:ankyrin repeat protein